MDLIDLLDDFNTESLDEESLNFGEKINVPKSSHHKTDKK